MVFDIGTISACIFGLFLVYLCCFLFAKPLKWIFKLMLCCLIAAALMFAFNFIGGYMGLHIPVNPLTAMICGVLGLPGAGMIFVLQLFI